MKSLPAKISASAGRKSSDSTYCLKIGRCYFYAQNTKKEGIFNGLGNPSLAARTDKDIGAPIMQLL